MLKFNPAHTLEVELLLNIARDIVYKEQPAFCNPDSYSGMDYNVFLDYARYHEMLVFAYLYLKKKGIAPADKADIFLRNNFYTNTAYMANLKEAFLSLASELKSNDIISIPLKGMSLAHTLYKDIAGRQSSDIDILIKEDDLPRAEGILEGLGYKSDLYGFSRQYWRRHQYHLIYSKKSEFGYPITVELHWALDYRRRYQQLVSLWQRSHELVIADSPLVFLSKEDELFSFALHIRHFGKISCIKNVCDVALLISRYRNSMDWDYIFRECRRSRLYSCLFFILEQARILLGLEIPANILGNLKVPAYRRSLIRRFITEKTFEPNVGYSKLKKNYLEGHFLFFDGFWEPVDYLLNIPKEQFARFYGLDPYSPKTQVKYNLRIPYIILRNLN